MHVYIFLINMIVSSFFQGQTCLAGINPGSHFIWFHLLMGKCHAQLGEPDMQKWDTKWDGDDSQNLKTGSKQRKSCKDIICQNSGPSGTIKTKILKVGDVERVGMVPTCFVGTEGPNISMTGLVEVAVSSLRVETRKVIALRCEEATVYTAATTNGRVITEPFGLCSDHVVAWCNLLKKRGMVNISYQSRCLVAMCIEASGL